MQSMKIIIALTMMVMATEALFCGTGLCLALGLKALGLKAFGVGALLGASSRRRSYSPRRTYYTKRRWGRSIQDQPDYETTILEASLNDEMDCTKKLICNLNAQESLTPEESAIVGLFGQKETVELTSSSVEFDVAALIGKKVGEAQCAKIYARCPYQTKDLMDTLINNAQVYNNL